MNEILKPWIVIGVALLVNLVSNALNLFSLHWILRPLFWLVVSFAFGMSLNDHKRKSSAWVLKLVIAGVLLVLFLYEVNLIEVKMLNGLIKQLYIEPLFFRLVYIWCGWAFFRK